MKSTIEEMLATEEVSHDSKMQYLIARRYLLGDGVKEDAAQGVAWLEKAADNGSIDAISALAACYYNGTGVERDISKAFQLSQKGAEAGDMNAMHNLALAYRYGLGVEKNTKEAFVWLKKSDAVDFAPTDEEASYLKSMIKFEIAQAYFDGEVIEKDIHSGLDFLIQAIDLNSIDACVLMESLIEDGTLPIDDCEIFSLYLAKAAAGSPAAQYYISVCYEHGRGTEKDTSKTLEWLARSAEQGLASAQNYLGYLYEKGQYVEKSKHTAFDWFIKAAQKDLPIAQRNVSGYYYRGLGVQKDWEKAFYWMSKAAKHGLPDALYQLGGYYMDGIGTTENFSKAIKLYDNAAKRGYKQAQKEIMRNIGTTSKLLELLIPEQTVELHDVAVHIASHKRKYCYYMTNSIVSLSQELASRGLRTPRPDDFKPNPQLAEEVMVKMEETDTVWSMETETAGVLNFYLPNNLPFICYLKNLSEQDNAE